MNAKEREIVKSLVQIVWADGEVDDREREILGKVLAELDLSRKDLEEVAQMMTEAPQADLASVLSQSVEERHGIMKLMLAMAMANGHLNPPELRYVQAIANKLEIGRDELDQLRVEVKSMTASSGEH